MVEQWKERSDPDDFEQQKRTEKGDSLALEQKEDLYQKNKKSSSQEDDLLSMDIYKTNNNFIDMKTNQGVIGFSDLRKNISEVIENVMKNFLVVESGHGKKNNTNTVSIIATDLLEQILSGYKFTPIISYDEETKQFEAIVDEINVYGCGDSKEDAIKMVLSLAISSTKDYFSNLELYMRIPEYKAKYPYYLRISKCKTLDDLEKVLNLAEN